MQSCVNGFRVLRELTRANFRNTVFVVDIEFDRAKNEANLAKHGVPLVAALKFDWSAALEREDDRFDYGEARFVAIGFIGDHLFVLVFAEGSHDDAIRVISLRSAEKHEVRYYYAAQV